VEAQTLGGWLEALASKAPAPGGGAAAALHAAVGAALVEMVCNLTIGKPAYAQHEPAMKAALDEAAGLRARAVRLADLDTSAFGAVAAAYRLPKDTGQARAARSARIQAALVDAAEVPLEVAAVAAEVVGLAGRILDGANRSVLADVAVAAASARAALDAAAVNVEVNLAALTDPARRAELAARLGRHAAAAGQAGAVVRAVRDRVGT
jgi:formiminotetrahydrofolate cyclodeaminase